MSDVWIAVEMYDWLEVEGEIYQKPMLVVGPFPDQEEAERYAKWVRANTGPRLLDVWAGALTKVPAEFGGEEE